jgi:hypothetical protein
MAADEEDEQLAKGEARRDVKIECVHEHGVQDRCPMWDVRWSMARRWCRLVGAGMRTGTGMCAIAIATWWDDKGTALSLAALNPFAGDAVLQ